MAYLGWQVTREFPNFSYARAGRKRGKLFSCPPVRSIFLKTSCHPVTCHPIDVSCMGIVSPFSLSANLQKERYSWINYLVNQRVMEILLQCILLGVSRTYIFLDQVLCSSCKKVNFFFSLVFSFWLMFVEWASVILWCKVRKNKIKSGSQNGNRGIKKW